MDDVKLNNFSLWKWLLFGSGLLLVSLISIFEIKGDIFHDVTFYGWIVLGVAVIMLLEAVFIQLCFFAKDTPKKERAGFFFHKLTSLGLAVVFALGGIAATELLEKYGKPISKVLGIVGVIVLFFYLNNRFVWKKILNERKEKRND